MGEAKSGVKQHTIEKKAGMIKSSANRRMRHIAAVYLIFSEGSYSFFMEKMLAL